MKSRSEPGRMGSLQLKGGKRGRFRPLRMIRIETVWRGRSMTEPRECPLQESVNAPLSIKRWDIFERGGVSKRRHLAGQSQCETVSSDERFPSHLHILNDCEHRPTTGTCIVCFRRHLGVSRGKGGTSEKRNASGGSVDGSLVVPECKFRRGLEAMFQTHLT